jgi:hypothetical protein
MHKTYIYSEWMLRLVILIHSVGEARAAIIMGLSLQKYDKRCKDWSFSAREMGSLSDFVSSHHYRQIPGFVKLETGLGNACSNLQFRFLAVCDYISKNTSICLAEKCQDPLTEEVSFYDLLLLVTDALNEHLDYSLSKF